mmetsp:Transcript_10342/g.26287  ORF Transcript_10342/g.26287 Transcript_10342/m.26287 type:complete len:82 (-) Transcript_10342:448-693(-)
MPDGPVGDPRQQVSVFFVFPSPERQRRRLGGGYKLGSPEEGASGSGVTSFHSFISQAVRLDKRGEGRVLCIRQDKGGGQTM